MRLQRNVVTMGLGAGAMYLLDPENGKRRRALVRDQVVHLGAATTKNAGKAARDLRNRTRGAAHELTARLQREEVDDVVLQDRVRARLGHVAAHPHGIQVTCEDGCVTVSGRVDPNEREAVLTAIGRVRGVCEIVDTMEPGETAATPPALGGTADGERTGGRRALTGVALGSLALAAAGLLLRSLRGRGRVDLGESRRPAPGARLGSLLHGDEPALLPAAQAQSDGEGLMFDGGEPLAGGDRETLQSTHH
jgi:hypothetical protein